ncbi:MAG: DUF397 domain-containing protein [Streptosporangiaceae bacterium]
MDPPRVTWRKSSRSANGANCVEVGVWRKSSRSASGSNCVEVAGRRAEGGARRHVRRQTLCLVRDSKDRDGPVLAFAPTDWSAFIGGVKHGAFESAT